ncbi:alpha-glucoside-specific PTS transporter subunit IIBC [Virgibacillus sp. CBA3643]|uniref:alpha-glucoside-specific PTS transporter subunit IIBC n=1 Tax=Virgibacillus sp. CBA3643 TaxID=2942278 RepID=UPI0035A3CCD4
MMQKLQRFGGAMFIPVLILPAMGLLLGLGNTLINPDIVGDIAREGTLWYIFWNLIVDGSYVVFENIPLLFVIGLPIGLAKVAKSRAALEAFVIYMFFNMFINSLLTNAGTKFGVDFSQEVGGVSGLADIGGVKTLDTSMIGALIIAGIVIWLHNRYYDKKLPEVLAIFQGSALVTIIGFFVMIPVALITVIVWPVIQDWIVSLQGFLSASGTLGVGLFSFLERILIPTGLHHFVWQPFVFGPAAVSEGLLTNWFANLGDIAASSEPIKSLFPGGGFMMFGNTKVFGSLGIAIAIILASKPEKRKKTIGLIVPVALTAVLTGITEPLEFTFLFIAPFLFVIHAVLAGLMVATMYALGVSGNFYNGLIDFSVTWASTWPNHWQMWLIQIGVGLAFTAIYVILFRYLIVKFNILTPGREKDDEEGKLYTKEDYKEKKNGEKEPKKAGSSSFDEQAANLLADLGGSENIEELTNCATRLRLTVKDPEKVKSDQALRSHGAHGVVRNKKAIQVIVGLSVGNVKDKMDEIRK